jgi:hypothetical protein
VIYSSNNYHLPVFRVQGSLFNIGKEVGQRFRSEINRILSDLHSFNIQREYDQLHPHWVDKLIEFLKQDPCPYLAEIQGIAQSSQISLRNLLIHNFRHSFSSINSCSTIILRNEDSIILAHNEDCALSIAKNSYILQESPSDHSNFMAFTYGGSIPGNAWGFNCYGLAISCNALPWYQPQIGFPRLFLDRTLMEAHSIAEALNIIQSHSPRAGVFSYNIISMKEMQAINIETDSTQSCITHISDRYFHTNHYISEKFHHYPIINGEQSSTFTRYQRGFSLLFEGDITSSNAIRILSDPEILVECRPSSSQDIIVTANTFCVSVTRSSFNVEIFLPHNYNSPVYQFGLEDLSKINI